MTTAVDVHVRERDLFADALGRLLVVLGGVTEQPLTGPQLLAAAEDAIEHFGDTSSSRPGPPARDPQDR